jgi:hypothetical protein
LGPGVISGGFYIIRVMPRPTGLGTALLPAQILTLSNCLTEIVPDWWALEWASCSREERLAAMAKVGLRDEALPTIVRIATDAFARGELGWPCVWQSSQAARAALAAIDLPPEFMILELGIPPDEVAALIAELEPPSDVGECGLLTRLKAGRGLEASGVALGWEVLGVEHCGSFHSWLCNAIHEDAHNQLGIKPGNLGLLSEGDARSVEVLIEGGLGAEPVPWFRGLLNRLE